MIQRIQQRGEMDCVTCGIAMVMGPPFSYKRVEADSKNYPTVVGGKFVAWWEEYLRANGFQNTYRPFVHLYELKRFGGKVVGLLGMTIPHEKMRHIVAVDEIGIVDPANNAPDHADIAEYIANRVAQGLVIDDEFLAINRPNEP